MEQQEPITYSNPKLDKLVRENKKLTKQRDEYKKKYHGLVEDHDKLMKKYKKLEESYEDEIAYQK